MARRKFSEVLDGETGRVAKIYWDAELSEYSVEFYKGTTKQANATYYSDCRLDALSTAQHWTKQHD